ncbi:MAG TPA: hypothetical protein VIA80_17875 [Hyphomonadaceae bacterium]
MPDRHETLLAMEAARVLALQNRVVEHESGADEVDAVKRHILPASGLFPLEHSRPLRAVSSAGYTAAGRFGEPDAPPRHWIWE